MGSLESYKVKLSLYIDEMKRKGNDLPTLGKRVNASKICRDAGIPDRSLHRYQELAEMVGYNKKVVGEESKLSYRSVKLRFASQINPDDLTYADLIKSSNKLVEMGVSSSSIPSYLAALRKWVRKFKLHESSKLEPHFGREFSNCILLYTAKEDRFNVSRIKKWRELRDSLCTSIDLPDDFSGALAMSIASSGKSLGVIAGEIGVKANRLSKLIADQRIPMDYEIVTKLEIACAVPAGTLESKLPKARKRLDKRLRREWFPKNWLVEDTLNIKTTYRRRAQMVADRLSASDFNLPQEELKIKFDDALKEVLRTYHSEYVAKHQKLSLKRYKFYYSDWPKHLRKEYEELSQFKKSPDSFLNEDRIGRWSDETAELFKNFLTYFFGYLILSEDSEDEKMRGLGMSRDSLSLALLSMPGIVKSYLDFRSLRSEGYNAETRRFISIVTSLLRPKHGWLWQNTNCIKSIQSITGINSNEMWRSHCEEAYLNLVNTNFRLKYKRQISQSRDTVAHILPILDADNPIGTIMSAIEIFHNDLKVLKKFDRPITLTEAHRWRTLTILSLLIRLPLRAKNLTLLTYRSDNTGHLRQQHDGGWQLVIPYSEFKNRSNTNIFPKNSKHIIISFDDFYPFKSFIPVLVQYIEEYWPYIKGNTDFLFPTTGKQLSRFSLNSIVTKWSEEYVSERSLKGIGIRGVRAFGPHAFRDIVATGVIKETGSFELAANILLDDPKTVAKHYARFLPEDRLSHVYKIVKAFGQVDRGED
ncbi:hypothetical protein [Deinococcus wulumuqiensis]|uniref:hypothetical protein n=1 Tax=Deinococcus wulumuqiensis TaxID=980427 RepID=UPI0013C2C228|nr:hypothetical protein [Deinococcus wulumuqiensis]